MKTIEIASSAAPGEASRAPGAALFARGFRPFFLAAGVHAAAIVGRWLAIWVGLASAPHWQGPLLWHGHEMTFGFVAAAIAGFLTTAVPVWTGRPALSGWPLAALFGLWCAGRLAFWWAGALPAWLIASIDGAFLPALAIVLVRTLRGSGQYRNYGVVAVVGLLALANAVLHAGALGWVSADLATRALHAAVAAIVVLLLVVGGRITPAFTANALRRWGDESPLRTRPWLDRLAIGAALLLVGSELVAPRGLGHGVVATIAGLAALARMLGWRSFAVRRDPLLWSLHAGMAWIGAGLLLVGASDLGAPIPPSAGLHALTVGAIGSTIVAVMTRVGLGHTGRALVLPRGAVASYALVNAAALLRIGAAAFPASHPLAWLIASGLAWMLAFAVFTVLYWPILTVARPDGRPG